MSTVLERPALKIEGRVARGFERVRDAFAANFERADEYRECGAALAVYVSGSRSWTSGPVTPIARWRDRGSATR